MGSTGIRGGGEARTLPEHWQRWKTHSLRLDAPGRSASSNALVPGLRVSGEKAPSHRVLVGRAEIGAAWTKTSNEGREYPGLKLDDPSFAAPIYANLFDDEDGEGSTIMWSRPNSRRGD